MSSCKCKVGACRSCPSFCRRCGFGCDGVSPHVAVNRKRGERGLRNNAGRSLRPAAKKSRLTLQSTTSSQREVIEPQDNLMPITTTADIWKTFGWSRESRKSLPSEAQRISNMRLNEEGGHGWSCMVQTVMATAMHISEVLYPAGSAILLEEVARTILDLDLNLPTERKSLLTVLSDVSRNAPKRSIQGRVVRAVLVDALSRKRLAVIKGETELTMGGRTVDQAYIVYNKMALGQELEKSTINVMRFNEKAVEEAVKYMLNPSNVGTLSWGYKKVKLNDQELVSLPALRRRKARKDIYENYNRYCTDMELSKISRSSFYNVITLVTCGEEKLLTAVDYITDVLINDQVALVQRIGEDFASTEDLSKRLTDFLELVRNFLRQQYDAHVRKNDDNVHTHGIFHCLKKKTEATTQRTSTCNACSIVGVFFEELRDCIRRAPNKPSELIEDALDVVDGIQENGALSRPCQGS